MLIEAYIEALLVDEELADLVGEALDAGLIPDEMACIAWLLISISSAEYLCRKDQFQETHRHPIDLDRES